MQNRIITYSKKVCMLGTFGVGKTSLVRRFVHNLFNDQYLSTIGVQIYEKQISDICDKKNEELKLILWDLANIEKFTPVIQNYFKGASAAIVVFDVTRTSSFNEKDIYLNAFLEINPNAKIVMAANKIDLLDDPTSIPDNISEMAEKYSAQYVTTSAKTGQSVESLFKTLGKNLLDCD